MKQMVKDIRIEDYDYPLPQQRIAAHPLADRDRCRLLVAGSVGKIADRTFDELPALLDAGSLMVCNNTRVINARIRFVKPTGAQIEVFLLEPSRPADYAESFQSRGSCRWKCLVGNLKRWKEGSLSKQVTLADGREVTLSASRLGSLPGNAHEVEFSYPDDVAFADVAESAGKIPIPPYLCRDTEEADKDDYQTVYSKIKGSVAAPTAGLHFTPAVLDDLDRRGIGRRELTLHVGAGTFQPVKSDTIGEHPMHTEYFSVSRPLIESLVAAIEEGRPVVAVGTTTVRTLESLPYLASHLGCDMHVGQWEAYGAEDLDTLASLRRILDHMQELGTDSLTASTAIMIAPGFRWRIVRRLVTNFHQPQSTLLLLVSSFLGEDEGSKLRWRELYDHALSSAYRFLSYGDACLLTRK